MFQGKNAELVAQRMLPNQAIYSSSQSKHLPLNSRQFNIINIIA